MHPSEADTFEWDEDENGNVAHLRAAGIEPWEAEEVFLDDAAWVPDKSNAGGDWKMIGRTDGGRPLTIVVQVKNRGRTLRPFTGWAPTAGERTRYLRS